MCLPGRKKPLRSSSTAPPPPSSCTIVNSTIDNSRGVVHLLYLLCRCRVGHAHRQVLFGGLLPGSVDTHDHVRRGRSA
jgi:hypothetical protein